MTVFQVTGIGSSGRLRSDSLDLPCRLGRAGIVRDKREGDGGTPVGEFPLRCLYYRADRLPKPETKLPAIAIDLTDGWCDDPADPAYNRPIKKPYVASHEDMWRDDHLYDVVVVIGHNDDPPIAGAGSAIFMHFIAEDGRATAGCIALDPPDMLAFLKYAAAGDRLQISAADNLPDHN